MDQESSSLDCEDSVEMEFICFLGSYYNTIIQVIHSASSGRPYVVSRCGYFFFFFFWINLVFIYRCTFVFFKPAIQWTGLDTEANIYI